jgi:hypothetical protein
MNIASGPFVDLCISGNLAGIQALDQDLTPEIVRMGDNQALREACCNGHLEIAQWLTKRFELTADDVGATLLGVCEYGHLELAQWLVERFGLTFDDTRYDYADNAFLMACATGHLKIAQWLTEHFGLTAEDVRETNNWALHRACNYGRLEVVQWLTERFGLTAEDARDDDNWALHVACENGHLDVAQWLIDQFGLIPEDLGEYADEFEPKLDFSGCGLGPKFAAMGVSHG